MSNRSAPNSTIGSDPTGRGLAVVAALFCFSAGPIGVVVQKHLVATFSPFLIIAIQMIIGACVLWAIRIALFPKSDVPRSAILKGLALGTLHPGAFMILYTTASGRLDSITAVLLLALMPALVAIGGRLCLKETLRPIVLVGILISITGLVVLVSERHATGETQPLGLFLGFLGLCFASASVLIGRALNTGGSLPWYLLAPLQVTGAAIVAWGGVFLNGVEIAPSAIAEHIGPFAYLALGMTAASYMAYNFALSKITAPILGLLAAAGPGVGAIAAALIFRTEVGVVAAIGIAVILFGAALPSALGFLSKSLAKPLPDTQERHPTTRGPISPATKRER